MVSTAGIPIGPTWHSRFFLGADANGRDVAVRLLYGGRNSLEIGAIATLITMLLATIIGTVAGYFRGWPDAILGRAAGPHLGLPGRDPRRRTRRRAGGRRGQPRLVRAQGQLAGVPAVIIGVVYVPYAAKPIRGQVLGLREREFIDAARTQGLGNLRIMASEVLPNIASTIIVFIPLIVANAILLEAGLSYLGAGVQDPNPSWGTMISDGIRLIPAAIHLTFVPGFMLVLAVLGINVFGDGVRDALDPRSKVRIGRH